SELLLCHGMVCVVGRMRDLILQLSKSSIYSTKPLEDGIDGFLGLTWNQELAATIDRLESLDRNELRKQFSIKRLNEMEIYPGVTFSEELEGQLFASIMLDMEKLISAYRRMLRQGNHALTVIVG
ncbi:DUF1877 family protein, partial [Escherichia coli]